jgi:dTDP-4-amino-4,6-dideoxygalactose transaminase
MQARIILGQLDGVDDAIRARVGYAQLYHEGLRDVPGVLLPPLRSDFSHTYSYFPIQVEDRKALLRYLMQERCDVAGQHLHNCADLPCFQEFHRDCPNARATAGSVVLLPTYPRYSRRDVQRNIRVIRAHFGAD